MRGSRYGFEIVGHRSQGRDCRCRKMAWKEEGEGKLVVLVNVAGFRLGEEVPCFQVVDTFDAFGTVFCDRLFGSYGGVHGHNELGELDFT